MYQHISLSFHYITISTSLSLSLFGVHCILCPKLG
jgi:hypothetical protein